MFVPQYNIRYDEFRTSLTKKQDSGRSHTSWTLRSTY